MRSIVLVAGLASTAAADPLELTINLANQTFDWVEGTLITQGPGIDNNIFGTLDLDQVDVGFTNPLAAYSGNGDHTSVLVQVSNDGLTIQGLAFFTTLPPGEGATFAGDAADATIATYALGSFAELGGLDVGSYVLSPNGPWDDGVQINVVAGCEADCNGDGVLNILDFVCFQGLFVAGSPDADCDGDGLLNILDFVCFQQKFVGGC